MRRLKKPQRSPSSRTSCGPCRGAPRRALPDDAGEDGASAHVAAGEPDAGEQKGGARFRRGEADVGGHGDDRAGADADPVDRGDDRLAAADHRLDEIAGEPGEGEQALGIHRDERADDVVDIAAGREVSAVRAEHDGLDIFGLGEGAEGIAKLTVAVEGERVLAVRPVQGDERDGAVHVPAEMLGLEAGHGGHGAAPPGGRMAMAGIEARSSLPLAGRVA
jgi:hypothetical protein